MRTFTAAGLFVLLACSAVIAAAWPPPFCNKLDCPKYTVTRKNDFYETRIYTKGKSEVYIQDGFGQLPGVCLRNDPRLLEWWIALQNPRCRQRLLAAHHDSVRHTDSYICAGKWASTEIQGYVYAASLTQGFYVSHGCTCLSGTVFFCAHCRSIVIGKAAMDFGIISRPETYLILLIYNLCCAEAVRLHWRSERAHCQDQHDSTGGDQG